MGVVLDYSNWRPQHPADLKAAGVEGVVRYIAPASWGWPKALTPAELSGLLQSGLRVGFNFEAGTSDYKGGGLKGSLQGGQAKQAMVELGLPGGEVPVYLSIDTAVAPSDYGLALAYIAAFHGACGHVQGLYGQGDLIEWAANAGHCKYGWQSESTAFPGNAAPTAHTVLRQVYGQALPGVAGQYDVNQIVQADWGYIPLPATVHAAGTPPLQIPQYSLDGKTMIHVGDNDMSGVYHGRQVSGGAPVYGLSTAQRIFAQGPLAKAPGHSVWVRAVDRAHIV